MVKKLALVWRVIKKLFCNPWAPSIAGWVYSFKGNLFKTMSPDIKIILQLLLGLSFTACVFWIYAYYSQKIKSGDIPEEFIKLKIEKSKNIIRDYLFNQKTISVCPRCNNKSFDVVGMSKIDNFFVTAKKPLIIPLIVLGCNLCGHIEIMNYTIVDNNLTKTT